MTAAAVARRPRGPRRFRVQFMHRCALSLPYVQLDVDDVADLPRGILDELRVFPSIPGIAPFSGVPVTVSVAATGLTGRVVVDGRCYPFQLAELDVAPGPAGSTTAALQCTQCGDPYDDPPAWLLEFVRPGLCWRCG